MYLKLILKKIQKPFFTVGFWVGLSVVRVSGYRFFGAASLCKYVPNSQCLVGDGRRGRDILVDDSSPE